MKNSIATYTFQKLLRNLGIEPAQKETQQEKYNEWMKKMGNVHYYDHEAMIRGYEIIKANNE